jgi:diketogulonate reductase-like aldo/keto reductase
MGPAQEGRMRSVTLPGGETVPALGQGTWMMGEEASRRKAEIATLREGIERGMTLIDTAEMYGDGRTEALVGEAIGGRRDTVFLVSKAYPQNAGRQGLPRACERSLQRLGTDRLDLYLLHWRGGVPLAETVEAFERLREAGKIRHWGVSNLDVDDMEELVAAGGGACAANQVLYNLTRRGVEFDLLPWQAERGIPVMAYSPVEQGRLPRTGALAEIAARHEATPYQVALAFVMRRDGVIAIPKAGRVEHLRDNLGALGLTLDQGDIAALDTAFAPPRRKMPLAML